MGKTTVTIRDVAQYASVSPSTVSLVLRNADAVHPRTRQQVEQAIGKLGYRRRSVGRPPRESRGFNIGIVYPGSRVFQSPNQRPAATRRWFDAIQEELRAQGHHLNFFGGSHRGENDPLFREIVRQGQLDGLIFIAVSEQLGDLTWAIDQSIPVVTINRRPQHGEFSSVEVDNYGAGRQVVDYLVELGHRRIAMAPAQESRAYRYNLERAEGFRDAVRQRGVAGLMVDRQEQVSPDDDHEAICQQVLDFQATALFCDGDPMACLCANWLQAQGIRVPEQISIIGFDDRDHRTSTGRRITSVGFDNRMLGQCTAEMIRKLILRRPGLVNMTARVRTLIKEYDTAGPVNEDLTSILHSRQVAGK